MMQTDNLEAAQAEFIHQTVTSIIGQAVGQGVDPMFAVGCVISSGAMGLRLLVGPDRAADHLREVAGDVEVEGMRFDA